MPTTTATTATPVPPIPRSLRTIRVPLPLDGDLYDRLAWSAFVHGYADLAVDFVLDVLTDTGTEHRDCRECRRAARGGRLGPNPVDG